MSEFMERWWPAIFAVVFLAGVFDPGSLINVTLPDGIFDWTFAAAAVGSAVLIWRPLSWPVRFVATAVVLTLCFTRAAALAFSAVGMPPVPALGVLVWLAVGYSYASFAAVTGVTVRQRSG